MKVKLSLSNLQDFLTIQNVVEKVRNANMAIDEG